MLNTQQMCDKHGITSRTSIANKAKRDGWDRDLSRTVKAETARTLIQAMGDERKLHELMDDVTNVKAVASLTVDVVMRHRSDIRDLADLSRCQLQELRAISVGVNDVLQVVARLRNINSFGVEAAAELAKDLRKLSMLPSRISALSTVTANFERLQAMERQAFGIKSDEASEDGSNDVHGLVVEFVEAPSRELE